MKPSFPRRCPGFYERLRRLRHRTLFRRGEAVQGLASNLTGEEIARGEGRRTRLAVVGGEEENETKQGFRFVRFVLTFIYLFFFFCFLALGSEALVKGREGG